MAKTQAVGAVAYWLTPVRSDELTAEEVIRTLVGQELLYAFGEGTRVRKHLKRGDKICFYASGIGVVAHADIASAPERKSRPQLPHLKWYPWVIRLDKVCLYTENPNVIDATTRSQLEAFRGRDPNGSWGWFVQSTRKVRKHDFAVLTKQK
jgi:hypothetical protein